MRIVYVSHYFLPFALGGTEEHTFLLARDMQRRGHHVHVFHGVIGEGLDDYTEGTHRYEGLDCSYVSVDLATITDFSGTWRQPAVERAFARCLETQRPDVVHIQHLTRLSLGLVDVVHARDLPVVLMLHDYWMQCARGQRMHPDGSVCHTIEVQRCASCMAVDIDFVDERKSPVERRELARGPARHLAVIEARSTEMLATLGAVDRLVTASRFTSETFSAWGVERSIDVVPYGVDPALRSDYAETPHTGRVRFAFLGRIADTKGVDILLDAFERVSGDASLAIHGAGDEGLLASISARAKRSAQPDRIRITGAYEREQLPRLYATMDVQIVPSTWLECSPLVVLTARLFDKPLIASAIGGLTELVRHEVDGLSFRPGDAIDLAAKLQTLVDDPMKVQQLKACVQRPREFAAYCDDIEDMYSELAR